MRSSFKSALLLIGLGTILTAGEIRAQQSKQWITKELDAGDYKLSSDEQNGVYFCSMGEEKIVDTQFENGYALLTFEQAPPRFFQEKELSPALRKKLKAVELGQHYSVLCIHSFFRDDWQERYDAQGTVNDKLLNIMKRPEREFARGPIEKTPSTGESSYSNAAESLR